MWTSSDAARWILSEFEQNSFNAWSYRILRLETRPGNGRSISPIFIESLSSSSSIGSLSDVKFVSTKVSLVRLKRWEVWNVTLESRLLVPFAYSHGIWIETCVIKFLCESFWLHHFLVKFQINTVSGRSQRLIKVVFNELSLFSRIFRPTTDSAETSGSWRRHYDNTGRKEKWDTEKNGYFNNANVQCHHLREWIDAWVCRLQTLFSWHLDLRIHGSSHKH